MYRSHESPVVPTILAVAAIAFLGNKVISSEKAPDDATAAAQSVATRIEGEIQSGKNVEVAAAVVAVDSGINYRTSPVVINTNNAQMVSGNTLQESSPPLDVDATTLANPTILVRPIVVQNENRMSDSDPEYWLAGLQGDQLVWVGVSDETKPYMKAYQLADPEGQTPDFTDTVNIDRVNTRQGVVFQSDGFVKSAALIRSSEGGNDPYLQHIQSIGYQEVPIPLG